MSPRSTDPITAPILRFESGLPAPYGLYVCARPYDIRFVSAEGETLEGREGATYRRIPTWTAVALSPVLGALFVIAFPMVVFIALLASFVRRFAADAGRHAYLTQSSWRPAAAYFHRERAGEDAADDELELELQALMHEVQARRVEEGRTPTDPPADPDPQ